MVSSGHGRGVLEAVVIFFIGVPLVLLIKKKVPSLVTRKAFLDETPADETKEN